MKETLGTPTYDADLAKRSPAEEFREYFKLAIPMLLTQIAAHATGIISALMTGNYNTVDQAAVAIGNMLFWPAYFGIAGVLFIVTSFVAQFYGAKKNELIGPLVKQSYWLAVPLILLFIVYILNAEKLLFYLGTTRDVKIITEDYLFGLMIGAPAMFLFQPLRSMCEGMKKPLPITYINIVMVLINASVNYILIFGCLLYTSDAADE